jgi:hypothetical protein
MGQTTAPINEDAYKDRVRVIMDRG